MTEKARKEYIKNPKNWKGCMEDVANYLIAEELNFKGQRFIRISVEETSRDYSMGYVTGKVEYKTEEMVHGIFHVRTICGKECLFLVSKTEMLEIIKQEDRA